MQKTIVVTGAGGLLGSHLVPLFEDTAQVWAVTRAAPIVAAPNVHPVPLDLSASLDWSRFPNKVDSVFYLAQSNRFRDFPRSAGDIFQVNTAQTVAMLDYAQRAGAKTFVLASTGGVYAPSREPLSEDSPLGAGLAFYPASKRAAEVLAEAYVPYFNVVILRYFFIYGPRQKRDMLIPRLVDSVRDGRPITLQGYEGLRINPVHAEDAARATLAAAHVGRSGTFNIAGPQTLSIREICDVFGEALGRRPIYNVDTQQTAPVLVGDIRAMEANLVAPSRRLAESVGDIL